MEQNKELNPNTIHLLRSLIKGSTALPHADYLIENKVVKFQLKKLLPEWVRKYEAHTNETMALLVNEDDVMTTTLMQYIDDFCKDFYVLSPEKTELFLFYSKLKSAYNDLMNMDESGKESPYGSYLISILDQMIKCIEGQFKYLTELKDDNGVSSMRIIEIFDQVGADLMFMSKQEAS